MPFSGFSENTLGFLAELSKNNDRAWFEAHESEYRSAVLEPAQAFVEALGARLRELDPKIQAIPRVRGSIQALERRRRFPTQDMPLYRDCLDIWFWSGRRRAWDNSGFFMRLTPSELALAGGMIEFQKERLPVYREHVLDEERGTELQTIVDELRRDGYVVGGESYKKTPRGVPADHPRAALLKHSGVFANLRGDPPKELGTPAFVDFAFTHFSNMSKLHAWLVKLRG